MAINLKYLNTRVVRYTLIALLSCAALVATGLQFELSKSDWSSWVQAIGSVAAVAVALYLSDQGFRRAVELDRRKQLGAEKLRLRHVHSLLAIALRDAIELHEAAQSINEQFLGTYDIEILADTRRILESLPKFDIPEPEVVFGIVRLCRHIKVVEATFKAVQDYGLADPSVTAAHLYASDLEDNAENLRNYAELAHQKVMDALGI